MLGSSPTTRRRGIPGGRPFTLLLGGLAVSSCGDWLYNVALLALVYGRTGSATWVALTTACRVIPIVLLGPLGGVLADRCDRRRLMIASDLIRAGLMGALGLVAIAGLPVLLAPLLAAAATVASAAYPPCVAASTPRLVPGDELQRAQALRAAAGQLAIVVGPALGAAILAVSAPAVPIFINAATFLASAAAVVAIAPGPAFAASAESAEGGASLRAELRAGADALRGAPAAVRLVAADVLCSAVYGVLTVTLVLVGRRAGAGDAGYGILLGAFGAGGIAGASIAGRISAPSRWRRMLLVALLLVSGALAALGTAGSLAEAVAVAVLGGGGMVVGEVLSETALPRMLRQEVLGRAYGLVLPSSLAGIVAGSLVAGPLVALLGLQDAMIGGALSVAVASALLLRRPLATSPGAAPVPSSV